MKGLFNPDGALFQALDTVARAVVISALCVVCCIPVVTAGAAFAATARIAQNAVRQEGNGTAAAFFRAFRENFRQGTVAWLIYMVILAVLLLGYHVALNSMTGTQRDLVLMALVLLTVFCVATPVIACQLMARYSNTLRAHAQNAFALTVAKFPRALGITAVYLLPPAVLFFSTNAFLCCLPLWIFVMPFFSAWCAAKLLNPVFKVLEGDTETEA